MNDFIKNEISPLDLDFGCCGYEWITYLDTSYYNVISTFDDFDHEINPRSELKLLANLPYDTIFTKRDYDSITEAIENSNEILVYLKSNLVGVDDFKIKEVLFYKRKALFNVGFGYYIIDLLGQKKIGIVQIDYLYE